MFPFSIILVIYLIIAVIFSMLVFFNLYHAWRFGMNNFINFFTMFLYMAVILLIVFVSYNFISGIDWTETIF